MRQWGAARCHHDARVPRFDSALTTAKLPRLFEQAYVYTKDLTKLLEALPVKLPVRVTEYNLKPKHPARDSNPAQQDYAQALFAAELDLMLPSVSEGELVDYWDSFDVYGADMAYSGKKAPQRTPLGLVIEWVDTAASLKPRARRSSSVAGRD